MCTLEAALTILLLQAQRPHSLIKHVTHHYSARGLVRGRRVPCTPRNYVLMSTYNIQYNSSWNVGAFCHHFCPPLRPLLMGMKNPPVRSMLMGLDAEIFSDSYWKWGIFKLPLINSASRKSYVLDKEVWNDIKQLYGGGSYIQLHVQQGISISGPYAIDLLYSAGTTRSFCKDKTLVHTTTLCIDKISFIFCSQNTELFSP